MSERGWIMDVQKIRAFFESLTAEEREFGNQKDLENHNAQYAAFKESYARNICYLCNEPFDQMRADTPCTHWLLRRAKFKKKDFPKIYDRFDYHNIAAFLRWCANEEKPLRNINDLREEKADRKVLSYTIKWKNIEWTFDCSKNDLAGHGTGYSSFPHYHFQMRIDGREFLNFNDFHIRFSNRDLFNLAASTLPMVRSGFGFAGAGMQDAVEVDPDFVLDDTEPTDNPEDATYDLSTIVIADDVPLTGEKLMEIIEEAKRNKRTFASVARDMLADQASVTTIISPAESIPDIAARTENKSR
jgi:hypothetical protein